MLIVIAVQRSEYSDLYGLLVSTRKLVKVVLPIAS
ncbi:MAG: hypothetical protein CM1200mP40_35360 [Gammaproteobacteria bacterium]|nr:MAG: hypothetical protein CM1200mP40_35360 [Gammaproteobacteria bacterium]